MKTRYGFEIYVKGEFDELSEARPMTKLTRGLLHAEGIHTPTEKVVFTKVDETTTGLTLEELYLCLKWKDAYFETHRYDENTALWHGDLSNKEVRERKKHRAVHYNIMNGIEEILGVAQHGLCV